MNITLKEPQFPVGYSSHGYTAELDEIVFIEADRGNAPFTDIKPEDIKSYAKQQALWVTNDPYDAFMYCLPAKYSEWKREDVIAKFPDWQEDIESIDTDGYWVLDGSDDGDGGVIIIEKLREPTKS